MTSYDVAVRATEEIARTGTIDYPVVELATAELLSRDDVEVALVRLSEAGTGDKTETRLIRRWMLARLMVLEQAKLPDDELLDRLEETYAEFGFPEEMRRLSRYNVEPHELGGPRADQFEYPLDALSEVVRKLRRDVLSNLSTCDGLEQE